MSGRHAAVRAAGCAALSAVLLIAGCSAAGPGSEPGPTDESDRQSTRQSTPSQSPTPTTMAPKAYQRELNTATEGVRVALARTGKAKDIPALAERLERAAKAAAAAAEQLRPLAIPEDVNDEHGALVAALDQLDADLGGVRSAVRDKQLCAPASALANLGGTKGYADLPKAVAGLKAKGYTARLGPLKTPAKQNRRLANGTLIREPSGDEPGTLEIDNGGDTDALITMTSGNGPVLSVYVRKGGNASTDGIPDGTYTVFFSTGEDWDGKTRSFTRNCLFQKFDDPVEFTTTATTYSINSLTLHRVMGGNATTSEVDPGDFPGR